MIKKYLVFSLVIITTLSMALMAGPDERRENTLTELSLTSPIKPVTDGAAQKQLNPEAVIWDNGMNYDGLLTSQDEAIPGGLDAEPADDFMFSVDQLINDVHWIGGYWNGPPDDGDFDWIVRFYSDDGTGTVPGALIASYTFPNTSVNETPIAADPGYFTYSVDLPGSPLVFIGGVKYWISIQSLGTNPPQGGWGYHGTPITLVEAVFRSIYFSVPDWTPGVLGFPMDMCFQLTYTDVGCSWNPGDPHKMHFPQLPNESGWAVNATSPVVLADDWQCSETGWIKDLHWWGGWRNGIEGELQSFVLSIHHDIPASQNPDGYSKPGALIWELEVSIDEISIVGIDPLTLEGWYDPQTGETIYNDHQAYYQYNFCLPEQLWFWQDVGTIYWVNISAVVNDPVSQWGWKSTLDHWNDDAVWGHLGVDDWVDMYEPGTGTLPPRQNNFDIMMDASGQLLQGSGTDFYGQGWYFYPFDGWWNIWFYDHPFAPTRYKQMHLEFEAFLLDPTTPGFIEVAINWSTDTWSLDQPPADSAPPLPGADEALYIGRQILLSTENFDGIYTFDFTFDQYNPEWVSIDVRGFNFIIPFGSLYHECLPTQDPVSLDLAFVVTGDPPQEDGACCLPDGTCILVPTENDCLAIGGVWAGVGTTCSTPEACCLPDGSCVMADPFCCEMMGGAPQGPGTQCTQPEACCLPDGSCVNVDPLCCDELGGIASGAGVACSTPEACCLQDGSCVMADPICCEIMLGGVAQGPGSQCTQPEACCLPDGTCIDIDPLCCDDRGGTPQGSGTSCAITPCVDVTGACCLQDNSCIDGVSAADCAASGGTYMGDNSHCLGDNNGNGIDDLCEDPWTPGDGHKMHYPQLPDETGWDVNASWPVVLADDWMCSETGWIKDIHFWGSWLDADESTGGIISFTFSIHSDIPAGSDGTHSRPGTLLWEKRIIDFKATKLFHPNTWEGYYDPYGDLIFPDNHQEYYQYDVILPEDCWFYQEEGTIYWLNITATLENPTSPGRWGWKSSVDHWNDDAVFGYDDGPIIVAPDDGTGTVALPVDGPYTTPDDNPIVATEGLPADASLEFRATFDSFFDITVSPGGNLGGDIVMFKAQAVLDVTGTGALSGFSRTLGPIVDIEMHTAPPDPGPGTAKHHIPTEMVSMSLSLFGDPDFDIFRIEGGSGFGLPSPGDITLVRLGPPGSDYQVDSFFDMEYRIDFQGAPGSILEGFGGTTQGATRLSQGGSNITSWTEMYEPPDFQQSLDLAFVMTGEPDQVCDCLPGDANNDGGINLGDAGYIINWIFYNGPGPAPYASCSGDANCDCVVNLGDAGFIINWIFYNGPAPCDCDKWLLDCGPPLYK